MSGRCGIPGRGPSPAPCTTPAPRAIICSSSSFKDDAPIAVSSVICLVMYSVASDWLNVCVPSFSWPACIDE